VQVGEGNASVLASPAVTSSPSSFPVTNAERAASTRPPCMHAASPAMHLHSITIEAFQCHGLAMPQSIFLSCLLCDISPSYRPKPFQTRSPADICTPGFRCIPGGHQAYNIGSAMARRHPWLTWDELRRAACHVGRRVPPPRHPPPRHPAAPPPRHPATAWAARRPMQMRGGPGRWF
jgi:hypothetical protein